jgi:hypothetical protein
VDEDPDFVSKEFGALASGGTRIPFAASRLRVKTDQVSREGAKPRSICFLTREPIPAPENVLAGLAHPGQPQEPHHGKINEILARGIIRRLGQNEDA